MTNFLWRCAQYKVDLLIILALTLLPLLSISASGQSSMPPTPLDPVAIENTNAAFILSDVKIPIANPARPTVTIPAHIPPTGYLQFEQGFLRADQSPAGTASQSALSQTTKIAITTRLLLQFLTEPYAYSTLGLPLATNESSSDPGDLQVGGQAIALESVGIVPTVALGYIRRVRAGTSASLDAGEYSQSALVLLGGDIPAGFHYDCNLLFNEQNTGPVRRLQTGQTLAISHPVLASLTRQKLGGTIELSHFTQPFGSNSGARVIRRANTLDLLLVATYSVRPNLILDASFSHGLTSTSTQWQGGFGFTYLLPRRLWPDRHPVPIRLKSDAPS